MNPVDHATLGMLLFCGALVVPVVLSIRQALRGKELFIRRIGGIDAIEEAVGRATELGRPISFSTGLTNVGPTLYACLGTLFHVARRAARLQAPLFVPQNDPQVMAIAEATVRDAYRVEDRLARFEPGNIRFLSEEQFAFAAGYMGLVQRERVGATFLFGTFAAESLILAEAGQQVGAMQIAATINPEQVPFFICTCDYTLIGEELFAASAYLTREPIQLGSLYGQDRAKALVLMFILVGTALETARVIFPTWPIPSIVGLLQAEVW